MKIVIKTKGLKLTEKLKDLIEKEINSLERFAQKFFGEEYYAGFFGKGKPRIEAWIEIEKRELFFSAKCQIRFPGKTIRAESSKNDLKTAVIKVKDELQREIKKYRERIISKTRRRVRILKKEFKLSPYARFYPPTRACGSDRWRASRKRRLKQEGI